MKIAVLIARIVLGLAFLAAGISGFLIRTPPPMPDLAGAFQDVYFKSHYVLFVAAVQAIVGVLFLINRFIGLALVISAALIFNILVFHITMFPLGIFPGLVLLALWLLVAFHVRPHLEPLLAAKTTTRS
jgi:putative oxidoreductase